MDTSRTIRIVIDANAAKSGAAQANAALGSIGSSARGAESDLGRADAGMRKFGQTTAGMGQSVRAANDNIKAGNNSILTMAKSLGRATIALAGLTALTGGVTALAMALTGASDKAGQIEAKLRNATTSTAAFAAAQQSVVAIANKTRSELVAVTDLYSKMSKNASTLGITTNQVGIATSTFAMALKVGGATAQQAESSILQLGQAMGSGVLNGDEFKSLSENADVFIKMLAKSMDVPVAALKKLGAEGKITGDQIAKALTDPKLVADIEAQFGKIPVSFADIRVAIGNSMIQIASALKEGLGIDASLAVMIAKVQEFGQKAQPIFVQFGQQIRQVFGTLAPIFKMAFAVLGPILSTVVQNMGSIVKIAFAVGAAFVAMKASMALSGAIAQVTALGVSMGATGGFAAFAGGAMGIFSAGVRMATGAVNTFTVALLANPLTAIAVVLTGTIALLYQFRDSIKIGSGEFGSLGDMAREIFSMIGPGFKALADIAKSVFSAIGGFVNKHFGWIGTFVKKVFGDINFSFFGLLQVAGTIVDGIAAYYINCFSTIKNIWSNLPTIMGAIVTSTANFVIGGIENMVNSAINGINGLINMANKIPGVNVGNLGGVSMGRVQGPAMPTGLIDTSSTGVGARGAVDAFGQRVEARGRGRQAGAAVAPAANDNAVSSAASSLNDDKDKKAKDAADAAKKQADAIKEYWAGLEQARDAAGLLGGELDRHNALLEYRKILGDGDLANARALTDAETTRITNLLQETATRKALADLNQENADLARAGNLLAEEATLLGTMSVERVKEEMGVRTTMGDLRARLARDNVNMTNAELDAAVALHETLIRQNIERERANRLTEANQRAGNDLLDRYGRAADPRAAATADRLKRDTSIGAAVKGDNETEEAFRNRVRIALAGSAEEFADDLKDISKAYRQEMLGAVDQIAGALGGKLGDVVSQFGRAWDAIASSAEGDHSKSGLLGGISKLFGGAEGKRNAFGQAADGQAAKFTPQAIGAALKNPMGSLSSSFSEFSNIFKTGGLVKGLGSAFGSAMQGANIGGAVAGVGKMLWSKFSSTGSQIGGAIGSMIGGPIGSIIGSIGGGIIGGLFKKTAKATSGITLGADGQLQISTSGNKAGQKEEAAKAGQSVVDGINGIAARLGATLGGNPNVGIGKYKDTWKVTGDGSAVGKKNGTAYGSAEDAIKAAVQNLISDGILQGLSSFSDRILRNAKNLDSAVSLAEGYEKLLKELGGMKDPLGYAIKDLTDNLDKMVKAMVTAGATSDELSKVEEYRRLKLDQLLKDQLGSLNDFKRSLSGDGSGVSALNRLTSSQNEFAGLQRIIASGGNVDQDEFTRIGQEVFNLAREVYGTSSSQFQAIRQALMAATDGAITNVTKQFDDATVNAIQQQTDQANQNATVTNDLLRQQNELLRKVMGGGLFGTAAGLALNGRYVSAAA